MHFFNKIHAAIVTSENLQGARWRQTKTIAHAGSRDVSASMQQSMQRMHIAMERTVVQRGLQLTAFSVSHTADNQKARVWCTNLLHGRTRPRRAGPRYSEYCGLLQLPGARLTPGSWRLVMWGRFRRERGTETHMSLASTSAP